jgi:hypothetical protein
MTEARDVLEAVLAWGDGANSTVIAVKHLAIEHGLRVGEDATCDLFVPRDALGEDNVEIAKLERGVVRVRPPARAKTKLFGGEAKRALFELRRGEGALMSMGAFALRVRVIADSDARDVDEKDLDLDDLGDGLLRARGSKFEKLGIAVSIGAAAIVTVIAMVSSSAAHDEEAARAMHSMRRMPSMLVVNAPARATTTIDGSLFAARAHAYTRELREKYGTLSDLALLQHAIDDGALRDAKSKEDVTYAFGDLLTKEGFHWVVMSEVAPSELPLPALARRDDATTQLVDPRALFTEALARGEMPNVSAMFDQIRAA